MRYERVIILLVLCIFVVGMVMGSATASHTIKCGKYKATISDKKYNSLKKGKGLFGYSVKTQNKYTVKKPKYKTKKVKKWKHIKVLESEYYYDDTGSDYYEYHTLSKYTKKGWDWTGSSFKTKEYSDGSYVDKVYYKFKKKVTTKKKVKVGYTKVKKPYNMDICSDGTVWVSKGSKEVYTGHVNL